MADAPQVLAGPRSYRAAHPIRSCRGGSLARPRLWRYRMSASSTDARRERRTSPQRDLCIPSQPGPQMSTSPGTSSTVGRGGEISIGRQLRDWKTLLSFGVSAAIVIFFVLTTRLDLAEIWANVLA